MMNIYVSQLLDFPLYYPSSDKRQNISNEIRTEISKQNDIKLEISEIRSRIDTIIDSLISNI